MNIYSSLKKNPAGKTLFQPPSLLNIQMKHFILERRIKGWEKAHSDAVCYKRVKFESIQRKVTYHISLWPLYNNGYTP